MHQDWKRSYQNNTYEVTTRGVEVHQTVFLSKQVLTTVAGKRRDARLRDETPPGAKRPLRMVSAFLGKYGRSNPAEEIGFSEFL